MLAEGKFMNHLILLVSIVFSLNSLATANLRPTLSMDCRMSDFQGDRMPQERRSFWKVTPDYEIHDLKGERQYDQELTEQIVQCYEHAALVELHDCNFNKMNLDTKKTSGVVASSENYYWQISEEQGQLLVHPAKVRYMRRLAEQIKFCFAMENLKDISLAGFGVLYDTMKILKDVTDENYNRLDLLPAESTAYSCRFCRSRGDAEHFYTIYLNGISVENDDGQIKIAR